MSHADGTTGAPRYASIADFRAVAEKLADITGQFKRKSDELEDQLDSKTAAVTAAMKRETEAVERELSARLTGVEQELVRKGGPAGTNASGNSLGAQLLKHPQFNELAALADRRGKVTLNNIRAMITSLPDSGGALIAPDVRTDPVMLQRRRLIVRNLIAGGTTGSNLVQYPRQTISNLDARVVSEGSLKPSSDIEFTQEDAPVRTIATWTKITRQALSDSAQLRTAVDSELRYAVALAEEEEILFGDGSGQHLYGIIPQATAFDTGYLTGVAHQQHFDALAAAITQSEVALLPATGIVMNDQDLGKLRTVKNSNGDYIASGGPFGPPITSIWGRPVVGTSIMPVDKFLVGAFFDGAQLYDREGVNLMVATENEDDFTHNLATALCEERLAFAVKRPQAFIYGTFPAVVT